MSPNSKERGRRQPRATGAATSGSCISSRTDTARHSPEWSAVNTARSGAEERKRDDLQALRLVHEKTLEELQQATRHLAWAQSELQRRAPRMDESEGRDQEEEIQEL